MKLVSLNCNHCGAPLEVPSTTRYVTCNYCDSRLEIHQSGSAVYSEVLESIDNRTEKIADDVETIKLQNELEQLDRKWSTGMQDYQMRGKDGQYRVPSVAGSMIGAVIAVVFGIFWIGFAVSMGAPVFFPLFGLVFIAVAVVSSVMAASKATTYREHRAEYEQQRRKLMDRIERH